MSPNATADPSDATIEALFIYHAPSDDQVARPKTVRDAAKSLAYAIHSACPGSPDRTAAMRQLQDAVMTANRSIVLGGLSYR